MPEGYGDVAEALKDNTVTAGASPLARAIREANGDPAIPAPTDYVAAVNATDGAVAIELNSDDTRVIRLEDPDDRQLLIGGDVEQREISTPIACVLMDEHGADLALYEAVAEAFDDVDADAQPVRPTNGSEVNA